MNNPSLPIAGRFLALDTITFSSLTPKLRERANRDIDEYISKARAWDIGADVDMDSTALASIAARAFAATKISNTTQTVIFRGDGYVDKQSQITLFFSHINSLSSKKAHKVHQRIIAAQTVLSALGTVATPSCSVVSRFGQFTEIQFDKSHRIVGAKLRELVLDKDRVIHVPPNERSYHIFYQFLAGATPEQKLDWKLPNEPSHWNYLSNGSKAVDKSDTENFGRFLTALKTLGLSKKSQNHVMAVLAAILHLGQIQFFETKNSDTLEIETQVRNIDEVNLVASLLGLLPETLESMLLSHVDYIGVDKCTVVHSVEQATNYTAKLASTLYSLLFSWLTEFINSRLHSDSVHAKIALLSLPGIQPTPDSSSPAIWDELANYTDKKLDNFTIEYLQALHNQYISDTANSSSVLNLPKPIDTDTRSRFLRNVDNNSDRLSSDVIKIFRAECTNAFVTGLTSLNAVPESLPSPVNSKSQTKSSSKRKSRHKGDDAKPVVPFVRDELDGTLNQLFTNINESNIYFVYCGHAHAAGQAVLTLAQPCLSSGLASCMLRVPHSRLVTRYSGLMTSRGLNESLTLNERVDGLLRGVGIEDHVVGYEHAWLTWHGINLLERDLRRYKEWKKTQRDDDGTASQYSAVIPSRRSFMGGFDDGASYVSDDDTYMSDTASLYDGFSVANGYSKVSSPASARNVGSAGNTTGLSRDVTPTSLSSDAPLTESTEKTPRTPRLAEKRPKTTARKRWVCFTWAVTWWIPSFCLSGCGGMKDKKVQLAWREKVALCLIIFLLSILVLFVIGIAGFIICPRQDWYNWNEIQFVSRAQNSKKALAAIYGNVYDLNQLAITLNSPTFHNKASFDPYAGTDITAMFRRHPSDPKICPGLNVDATVVVDEQNQNRTLAAGNWPSHDRRVKGVALGDKIDGILNNKRFQVGVYAITEEEVRDGWNWDPETQREYRFIVEGIVYDLTNYYMNLQLLNRDPKQDFLNFNPSNDPTKVSLPQYIRTRASEGVVDLTTDEKFMDAWKSNGVFRTCVKNMYAYGVVDDRNTWKCRYADYILLAMSIVLCCVIVFKFLAALQLRSGQETPEKMDKFVMIQVPCYTEDEISMSRTINSIAALKYDDKRKLMVIICDGMIVGRGNDRPTPRIVLDILGVDPNLDPSPMSYQAIGEGGKQNNLAKVYSGLYEYEGHLVPYVVLIKCGKESETNRPGNRGKRDSQMMLMRFLNHLHYELPMSPLELEMRHHIQNIIGVDPKWYEYCLMIDADTTVHEDSLTQLVAYCMTDTDIIGLCGETRLMNEKSSITTMIQVYEYFISHHLSKAFESLFGTVTCLPGCFCMYRIMSANKGKPMLCHSQIIEDYSDVHVDTLHKKNLLHLGEDRYLTTLMLKNFTQYKTKFTSSAIAYTFAPETFSVLLSQRRRWINSTFHNLFELSSIQGLCGFCCFSMRFMVMIDLVATIIQPATVIYLGYLIYLTVNAILKDQSLAVVQISLILIAAMYGLQAIIFILKKEFGHIVWMIIYVLAMPIFSFFLPLYSFWRFDDFSWGNTRVIVGGTGEKQLIREEDEYFDISQIKHMTWDEYLAETMETQSMMSHVTDKERDTPNSGLGSRPVSMLDVAAAAAVNSSRNSINARPTSMYSQLSLQQPYPLSPSMPPVPSVPSISSGSPGFPSDMELVHEIRRILLSADLMRVTKRQVRDELSALFGVDLTPRKDFINSTIDAVLQENI